MKTRREKERRKIQYTNAKDVADKQKQGFELTTITLPKDVKLFTFDKEGLYELDIVPFDPREGNPNAEPGFLHWERTYWVHTNIGPETRKYACPWKNSGQPCPVHNHAKKLRQAGGDSKLIEMLEKLSKRQVIRLKDRAAPQKGIQIYEGPYYNGLGVLIDNKVSASKEGSSIRNFYHLEGGKTLVVNIEKEGFKTADGGSGSFMKPTNVEMENREDNLDEAILDEPPHPDELIRILPYDDLQRILLEGATGESGSEPVAEDEDESTDDDNGQVDGKPRKGRVDLKVGDVVLYEDDQGDTIECEIKKISGDGTSLTLEDPEGDILKGIDPADVEKVPVKDEEEEEAPPKKSPGPKSNGAKTASPSEEEEEEEDPFADEDPFAEQEVSPPRAKKTR